MTNTVHDSNPFCTRFVRPAANAYLFADDGDASSLLERWQAHGRRGQIVGPHGSGKTTLLMSLRRELAAGGMPIVLVELHDGQRRLPVAAPEMARWDESTVVIVDGYEQLSRWSRWRLRAGCRRRSCGLLVTAHADVGLPLVYQAQPAEEVAQRLVARLLAEKGSGGFFRNPLELAIREDSSCEKSHPTPLISAEDVSREFTSCRGDVREMLFRLYDLYEHRFREQAAGKNCTMGKIRT